VQVGNACTLTKVTASGVRVVLGPVVILSCRARGVRRKGAGGVGWGAFKGRERCLVGALSKSRSVVAAARRGS
jgi:hypothetical protein